MRKLNMVKAALMLAVTAMIAVGCTASDEPAGDGQITVTTYDPQNVTQTTAVCGGEVSVTGGLKPISLGVCWGLNPNPTTENSDSFTREWEEPFTCTLENLKPNTTYHVRAYSYCKSEYHFGADKTFTTGSYEGGYFNGHEAVELGLPSGTLWASCNVGAASKKPEDAGSFFAWGETNPKHNYDWSTYKHCKGSNDTFTKYCPSPGAGYQGYSDNLTTLEPVDDAATANWGEGWSTPTINQWQELDEHTTSIWTTINGVNGRLFTGSNGKTIFLPAGGWFWGIEHNEIGTSGLYWTSTLSGYTHAAKNFGVNQYVENDNYQWRCYGLCVRPVHPRAKN